MDPKPQFIWDVGTAYDLFISLDVLHQPNHYGLRGNWAAGVRSRLPAKQREFLQDVMKKQKLWVLPWLVSLPGPKDSASVLNMLEEIPPARRLHEIYGCYMQEKSKEILFNVAEKGQWDAVDKEALREIYESISYKEHGKKRKIKDEDIESSLDIWANTAQFGEDWLDSLKVYYDVFFHEEEARIIPALEQDLARSKELADQLPLDQLLNELSQGLRFDYDGVEEMKELVMVPSFWTTPLAFFGPLGEGHDRWVFLYGSRPASMSLVPGEIVPELLHNTLKALADPTRLRILKYLSEEPMTPAELARRLRLRPPTVIHHLNAMRLARLVHLTLSYKGNRYEARREAIDATCALLDSFLNGEPLDQ